MYARHFGFREDPFGAAPNPQYLYCSPQHAEALAALHYGLLERRGLLLLVAPPGMGKTMLLHHLLERWKGRADTAFLFRPPETREEMIAAVLEDLGAAPAPAYADNCRRLRDLAVEALRRGRRLLLIFDEAQGISAAVLEEIRRLSNLETPEEKLVDIILAGQSGLAEALAAPDGEPLRQRVAIWAEIRELDAAEVRRYVEHRLRVAGHKRGRVFSHRALTLLARASGGVPRNINAICFEALSAAFARGRKRIDQAQIWLALPSGAPQTQSAPAKHRWAAAACLLLAAGLASAAGYLGRELRPLRMSSPAVWSVLTVAAAPPLPTPSPGNAASPPALQALPPDPAPPPATAQPALLPGLVPALRRDPEPPPATARPASLRDQPPPLASPSALQALPRHPASPPATAQPALLPGLVPALRRDPAPPPATARPASLRDQPPPLASPPAGQALPRDPAPPPATAPPRPAVSAPAKPHRLERVQVRRSDTMRQIALRKYGRWNPQVWRHIRQSNPGVTDPGKLRAGQILLLPEGQEQP